jgi:hypothetical protein
VICRWARTRLINCGGARRIVLLALDADDMTESILQLLVLLRFVCFVALVYLTLHVIFSRLISKPDSKILWFFSILTMPLTWPIRVWLTSEVSDARLRYVALVVYGLLWVIILVVTEIVILAGPL